MIKVILKYAGLLVTFSSFAAQVQFTVKLSPAGSFDASSAKVVGFATKEGDTFKAQNVVVDLNDMKTGIELRDDHMKKKYLEVEKFPTATLKSASGKGGDFQGELEVHGVTKPVTGKYEVTGDSVKAKFTVKMSDFNIAKAKYMGVGAKDEIAIESTIPIQVATAKEFPAAAATQKK